MNFKKILICLTMAVIIAVGGIVPTGTAAQAAEKDYTEKELRMMSAIIFCEAGNQCYAGKVAVGCVVMNRKRSSSFPNTIEGVLKQKGQFGPVKTGKFQREVKRYKAGAYKKGARKECVKAAKAALSGQDYVHTRGKKVNMRRYHFFNGYLPNYKLRISGHYFK